MDEKDYELLHALDETRNITHAADKLYMTQSALSKRIKALEQELGVEIVLRSRQGIRFTPAGEQVLLHSAAADGAGEQTLRPHQHLAARAAGGRAVIPHDGGQHGVLLLFPLVEQGLEDVVHMCLLSRAIGSGGAAPCSFIQPAASTAGREFATSALYWSMVRSQW